MPICVDCGNGTERRHGKTKRCNKCHLTKERQRVRDRRSKEWSRPVCVDCGKETESPHGKTERCNSCFDSRIKILRRLSYLRNVEKIRIRQSKYRQDNKDKILEKQRIYRAKNARDLSQKASDRRKRNAEKNNKRRKERYVEIKNRDQFFLEKERSRLRKYRTPEMLKAKREKSQKEIRELDKKYICYQLGIPADEASQKIIELKRLQIKLRRLCREKR